MNILDRIFKKQQLTQEVAGASVTGLRRVWNDVSIANGLTPTKLAEVFSAANSGNHHDYITLAQEMEEREPHYASVLSTRKRAVAGLDVEVTSASDDKKDKDMADAVRALVAKPEFGNLLDDLLDGLGKGYSACEIDWQYGKHWMPKKYVWRDQRFFTFALDDDQTLRLYDESDMVNGAELPAYKFIIHRPKLRNGIVTRGGLARLVAVSYMCKSYNIKDWMSFVETFGMPIRVGKYDNNASKEDLAKLRQAVASIGSNAAAIMPENMQIEFIEAARSRGGESLFENMAEWIDRQISKAVLGQTMTTDDGSSQAQANVHNDVRIDILRADAKALADTINRDLIKPFVDLNFGEQERYPAISLPVPDAEDLKLLVTALEKLVPLGFKVDQRVIRDKFSLPAPADDAELLGVQEVAESNHNACPNCGNEKALNFTDNALGEDELADWQKVMAPIVNPVQKLLNDCNDYDEFLARLPEVLSEQKGDEVIKLLAESAFKAKVDGLTAT